MRYRKKKTTNDVNNLTNQLQGDVELCLCNFQGLCECMSVSPQEAQKIQLMIQEIDKSPGKQVSVKV